MPISVIRPTTTKKNDDNLFLEQVSSFQTCLSGKHSCRSENAKDLPKKCMSLISALLLYQGISTCLGYGLLSTVVSL